VVGALVVGVAAAAPTPVGVQARTAAAVAVALLLTAGHRILCNQRARPDLPDGPFLFG
jgi:hypothetical protein